MRVTTLRLLRYYYYYAHRSTPRHVISRRVTSPDDAAIITLLRCDGADII